MANIAVMLKGMGKKVGGVDVKDEFITDKTLELNTISYSTNFHESAALDNYEVFIYSAAHEGSASFLAQEAQKKGLILISQPELIAAFVKSHSLSIAVAGCHGKTTTSSLIAWTLSHMGKIPSYLIGAPPFEGGGGGIITGSDYFVVEADEYGVHPPLDKRPKFLFLHPHIALCTNIDFDHPDVYDSLDATKKVFFEFLSQAQKIVVCGDDMAVRSLLPQLKKLSLRVYGTTEDCDYQITNQKADATGISFELSKYGVSLGSFTSLLFGEKNILNCAGAIATLLEAGCAPDEIRRGIAGFSGAKRRMETVWTNSQSYLIDDYGHHPNEIAATIAALRSRFGQKKLHVLFQPHTFSRTQELKDAFVQELSHADYVYLLPIFPSARENAAAFRITSAELSRIAMRRGNITFFAFDDPASLLAHLQAQFKPGDVALTLGAGDIYKLKDGIISILNEKST